MKHFIDARKDSLAALGTPELTALASRLCLIVDLQGRTRVVATPLPETDPDVLKAEILRLAAPAGGEFWSGDVWIESAREDPATKALYDFAWSQARPDPEGQGRLFVLDRRFSKDAWTGTPFDPPWPLRAQTPPILSFYSFKGGVGRTTALAAMAVNLARHGKKVAVVDFDLEAPGAGTVISNQPDSTASYGVVDFLIESLVASRGSITASDYYHICDDPAIIKDGEPIAVVPAGCIDEWYLEKLARTNYEFLYRSATENGARRSPLHELFKLFRAELQPSVFLVDSRSGLHDMGGMALSGVAHLQVLFGLNSPQSWAGLGIAVSHLGKDMVLANRRQRDCAVVHAMVPPQGGAKEAALQSFKERSFEVFSEKYYDSIDTEDAEWPVPDPESTESPHYPLPLTWDSRVMGYSSLSAVADYLSEGEYLRLTKTLLEKVGRTL